MGTCRLIFLTLLLSTGALAQTVPYFPPPGLSYNWTTNQIASANIASCLTNAQTVTSYTLALGDANGCVTMSNVATNTITIPTHASVAFPVGTRVTIGNVGSGTTRLTFQAGVTFNSYYGSSVLIQTLAQYTLLTLRQTATDVWQVDTSLTGFFGTLTIANNKLITNDAGNITLQLSDAGDFNAAGNADPIWNFQSTASTPASFGFLSVTNNLGLGPILGTGPSTATNVDGCAGNGGYAFQPATGPCEFLDTQTNYPLIIAVNFTTADFYKADNTEVIRAVGSASIKYLDAVNSSGSTVTTTLGDSATATSITNVVGGSGANTRANGVPILTGYSAVSGSIGGGALLAGQCSSGTTTVTGAATTMVALADPNTYPGDGTYWDAQVTSANTVTTKVCAVVALTPTASTYNIRVIQ